MTTKQSSPQTTPIKAVNPSVNSWSGDWLDSEYARFKADPASVGPDLRAFFYGFDLAMQSGDTAPAAPSSAGVCGSVFALIDAYRRYGHVAARLDPFGQPPAERAPEVDLQRLGLTQSDLARAIDGAAVGFPGVTTIGALRDALESRYSSDIGAEFMHCESIAEREFFIARIEGGHSKPTYSVADRTAILENLTKAELFETFIQKRYPGDKRFSLEGGETTIPVIEAIINASVSRGVEEMVIGMAHRGRLNVLNNIMGKTHEQIFTEFEGNYEASYVHGGGDVKYHRGYSSTRRFASGHELQLTLCSNPSHLESVNPVAQGRVRGKQRMRGDTEQRGKVMPLLIHGDAAVIGQGVVAECLNMAQLDGYTVGGTVHLVINNQIGFTTLPRDGRSTRYCTDVAKMGECPILHVNGANPEACVWAAMIAVEYRQTFGKDVWIDMVCFRKYGHNEQDEQSFTQPVLAKLIKDQPSVLSSYAQRLLAENVIGESEARAIGQRLEDALDSAQQTAKKTPKAPTIDPGGSRWKGIVGKYSHTPAETGIPVEVLKEIASALGSVPEGFNLNPKYKVTKMLETRAALGASSEISHSDAELLAIGSLLLDGVPVRLSGQDCRRGTFTQRHAVLYDFVTGQPYNALNNLREMGQPGSDHEPLSKGSDGRPRQARFCVYDSPLSEEAVLGFDYGYSMVDPNMLVMWEAQFGDFWNGAEVLVDQYIASSELKWDRWSGLVMLLPHGYEGAGPEHSSARLERFLQLCANDNMQVCYPTTAAQHFHMLRRQVKRNFRKPLIVMTPKSRLRSPTSSWQELTKGHFQEVLDDPAFIAGSDRKKVTRIILCSGKVYFDLDARRQAAARTDTAIIRVEQLYPLHEKLMAETLARYPAAKTFIWAQEEPRNAGAYIFIADLLGQKPFNIELEYIGRPASASPATGGKYKHLEQQEAIVSAAIGPATAKADAGKKETVTSTSR